MYRMFVQSPVLKATMLSTWAYWQKPISYRHIFLRSLDVQEGQKNKTSSLKQMVLGVPSLSFTMVASWLSLALCELKGKQVLQIFFARNVCCADVFTVLLQPLLVESAPLQWKPETRALLRCSRRHSMFKMCGLSQFEPSSPNPQELQVLHTNHPTKMR